MEPIREILSVVLPAAVRRPLRRLHRRLAFWRAMRRLAALPAGESLPVAVMRALVYGWGNEEWSAREEYLTAVVSHAWNAQGPILECGSGLSTVLLGVIAQRTDNRVHSLEHSDRWAERVRRVVQRYRIASVELHVRELRDYGSFEWYSPDPDRLPSNFALVVCDGPPYTTKGQRYGLLPCMGTHLQPGCVILLDDAAREGERAVLESWSEELRVPFSIEGEEKAYARLVVPAPEPIDSPA